MFSFPLNEEVNPSFLLCHKTFFSFVLTVMCIFIWILVPILDRILQPSVSVILGPVWVTRGAERFSPKGAYHFITTLLLSTKDRLKQSKAYKQQVNIHLLNGSCLQKVRSHTKSHLNSSVTSPVAFM